MEKEKVCERCGTANRKEAIYCKMCGEQLVIDSQNELPDSIDSFMPEIIGHKQVKKLVKEIIEKHLNQRKRGIKKIRNNDLILTGNSGTGKTLIVNSISRVLKENGILTKERPIILNAVTGLQQYLNEADKHLNELNGALLCVDSFQGLAQRAATNGSALTEIERLFEVKKHIEDSGGYLMIVLCGIDNGAISTYLNNNSNIKANFKHIIELSDYSVDELVELTTFFIGEVYKMDVEPEAKEKIRRIYKQLFRDKDGSLQQNGKYVSRFAQDIFDKTQQRDDTTSVVTQEDVEGKEYIKKTFEEAIAELDNYVGIDDIREEIKSIGYSIQIASEDGIPYELNNHYLFLGNPGTGKTTIARVLSNVFTALEALPSGHIIEVGRSQIVASYVGETAKNVTNIVRKAMGGILFIDEAYTLIQGDNDNFGKEAVDTLLALMENHRGKFIVIAAGYENEMRKFVESNPGLSSRFNKTIHFRDYKPEELAQIFMNMCSNHNPQYEIDPEYEPQLLAYFKSIYNQKTENFANARTVRNVFENAIERHNRRINEMREKGIDIKEIKNVFSKEDIVGDGSGELTVEQAMAQLDELIGMEEVKNRIKMLKNTLEVERVKIERGLMDPKNTAQHIVITGNPGTGKTTVAKLLGNIFHAIGLLPTNKVVEKEAKNLKSPYVNGTGILMNEAVDEAMGGILFIDEAYMLMSIDANGQGDQTGKEAVGALITRMTNDAGKFILIMAGYPKDMDEFVDKANPGFRRRFRDFIHINDYTADELYQIFLLKSNKRKYHLTTEADQRLKIKIEQMVNTKSENFGNAGEIDKLLTDVEERQSTRLSKMMKSNPHIDNSALQYIEAEDIPVEMPKEVNPSVIMKKLDGFVGLGTVKQELRNLVNTINLNKKLADLEGKPTDKVLDHYVFKGNPGTGKTTIAKMMAEILFTMGLLPTSKVVEVGRDNLVAGFVGQTAPKVKRVVESALGGVLFIDEAYSLMQGPNDTFGREAIDTLVPLLLTHKNKFICIVAGYSADMENLLNNNSGLKSRFRKTIIFEDYKPEELAQIFMNSVKNSPFSITEEARSEVLEYFREIYSHRDKNFGNARTAGNFFENVKTAHSNRVANNDLNNKQLETELLRELTKEDIINAKQIQ